MKPSLTLLTLAVMSVSTSTYSSQGTDLLHYTIGGGPVISLPARESHINSNTLGVSWDVNLQCGLLNPQLTVQNQLNGITDGFQNMMGNIINNATAAVLSLPGYYMQKRDPGLYDMMTNGVLQGKFDFDDGRTSCESMVETMGSITKDQAYAAMARGQAWAQAVKSGDAVKAKEDALKDMGDSGITWVGGSSAGGRYQQAINTTKDVSKAGFELLSDDTQKSNKQGMYRYWDDADDMSEWLTKVIGSQSIQTGQDKSLSDATPGVGLSFEVVNRSETLETELREALSSGEASEHYPEQLVDALNERKVDDNTIARIASELALSHSIEKALYARRALLTGQYEVNIAQHEAAQLDVDKAVSRLERDIDMLRYEAQVRQDIGARTAQQVVDDLKYQRPQQIPNTPKSDSLFLHEEANLSFEE